jgi:hypothetical protein
MKKDLIGKRVRVQIGGEPPKDDDAIVGEETTVIVPTKDLHKYGNIFGEKTEVRVGEEIDSIIENILSTIENSQEERRDEIITICKEILSDQDQNMKTKKIGTLVSIGSGLAAIAQFIIQLKTMTGL